MGFAHAATHRSKKVRLYRQGDINFINNMEPSGPAANFRSMHGPSANAMAFRVHDAAKALKLPIDRGATPVEGKAISMELHIPAIEGIRGANLYLVEHHEHASLMEQVIH